MSVSVHDAPSAALDGTGIPALREAVRADLEHMAEVKGCRYPSVGGLVDVLTFPGTWAVILFRLASTAHYKGLRPLSRFFYFVNVVLFGAELHPSAIVQPGLVIPHPVGIAMGGECRVGRRALLFRGIALGGIGDPKRPGQPVLGNDVVVFDSASVFGPVHVGDRSMIGTKALVVDDVEPDMFVFGARKSHLVRPLTEMGLDQHAAAAQHSPEPSKGPPSTPTTSISGAHEIVASNGRTTQAV